MPKQRSSGSVKMTRSFIAPALAPETWDTCALAAGYDGGNLASISIYFKGSQLYFPLIHSRFNVINNFQKQKYDI